MSLSLADMPPAATINAMPRSSATSRRRELSTRLKKARQDAGVTVEQAAETLGCSTDKIHWIERADWTDPKWRDVRDLLDRYGVADEDEREELIALARTGGEEDWWQPYSKTLSKRRSKYSAFLGAESDADESMTFELAVIPGLLQTEDYARGLLNQGPDEIDAAEIEERVQLRMERQRVLSGEDAIRLWAVLDEAALRRQVGGPGVMRAQLEHLVELAGRPNVTLQVLPFDRGAYPALAGSFTVLSFGERFPDVAYVETIGGELLIDKDASVGRYRRVFRRLNIAAATPEATIEMLAAELSNT
jgi:transcriptional regulator with XRE-family HTH domain